MSNVSTSGNRLNLALDQGCRAAVWAQNFPHADPSVNMIIPILPHTLVLARSMTLSTTQITDSHSVLTLLWLYSHCQLR